MKLNTSLLHELVESGSDPVGIRCDTSWCKAFWSENAPCGDEKSDYAGLVHLNRARRAEARDLGKSYESGVLFTSGHFGVATVSDIE